MADEGKQVLSAGSTPVLYCILIHLIFCNRISSSQNLLCKVTFIIIINTQTIFDTYSSLITSVTDFPVHEIKIYYQQIYFHNRFIFMLIIYCEWGAARQTYQKWRNTDQYKKHIITQHPKLLLQWQRPWVILTAKWNPPIQYSRESHSTGGLSKYNISSL